MKIEVFRQFFKNTQVSNLMKIRPVGTELFRATRRTEGRTDGHDEANSHFSQFLRTPQKSVRLD